MSRPHGSPLYLISDERSVLLEDLDALILPIRNPQQTLGVDIDAVRDLELTGTSALTAPRLMMNVPLNFKTRASPFGPECAPARRRCRRYRQ